MEHYGQNYFIKFKGVLMKQFKVFSLYFFLIVNMFSGLSVNAKSIVAADIVEGQQYVPNFLKNKSHLEKNANGITAYADAAGTRPVNGTGGAPTLSCTRTTSSPLDGDGSLLITKDAANRQGEGCGIQFTIDSAYKAKVLQIEMDYIVSSGTFSAGSSTTDSDLIVYLYDSTNSTLIEPSSIKFLASSTTLPDKFVANFQTSATGTTYNLILHQATTSASAYTFKADNLQVKPSQYVYGTPITDWVAYTPTYTGFGTTSNNDSYWRRVGDSIELSIKYTVGTSTATEARVSLPSGLTFGKFGTGKYHLAGRATRDNTGSSFSRDFGLFAVNGNSYLTFSIIDSSGTASGEAAQNGSSISVSGDDFVLRTHSIPIQGWSSSVQMSDSYDGRQIAFSAYLNSTTTFNNTTIIYDVKTFDKTASYSTSTGIFTAPKAGLVLAVAQGFSTTTAVGLFLKKNGSNVARSYQTSTANDDYAHIIKAVEVNAGDTLRVDTDGNYSIYGGSIDNYFEVYYLDNSQTISATEVVAARYTTAAGQSIPNSSTFTVIDFGTKDYDTHNAVTTGASWKFTAPIAGLYKVCSLNAYASSLAWTAGNAAYGAVFKGGSTNVGMIDDPPVWASVTDLVPIKGCNTVNLLAREYIDVRLANNRTGGNSTLQSSADYNYVTIERIK